MIGYEPERNLTWSNVPESFLSKLEEKLGVRQQPLKERINLVIYRLRVQRNKIESTGLTMQHRDKELFDKCVAARATGDSPRANLYAEECAEVRKIAKVVLQSELALEQMIFKLETAEMLGDIAYLVSPIKKVVSTVGQQVQHLMPEVSYELNQINETLNGFTAEAGNVTDVVMSTEPHSPEAERIFGEAGVLAEQKIKSRFPELHQPEPTATPT
jgi:division protein CdvB (Snf7/Vps24/ESCRT-III family)